MSKRNKLKLTLRDRFDDVTNGDRYVEITINKYEACCVKETDQGDLMYVMQCYDGNEVYCNIGGIDFPLRHINRDEFEQIMEFCREQFAVEQMMDEKFAEGRK